MPSRNGLIGRNVEVLRQGEALIRSLDAATYSRPIPGQRATVGAHFRHGIDFYERFFAGIGDRRVDYDRRRRDAAEETDPQRALARIRRTVHSLRELRDIGTETPLLVRAESGSDPERAWQPSSVGRELQFLLSHTVHHFAIVALVLRSWGCAVPETFGVAPSTLESWSER
ncbi:MAG: DinB family protein [Acidobacteria bacterium]|nr:MAG: DinB family protein [Acidobacteriota bacterium]